MLQTTWRRKRMKMRRTLGVSLAIFAISAAMPAKEAHSGDRPSEQGTKAEPAKAEVLPAGQQLAEGQIASARIEQPGASPAHGSAGFGPPDRYIAPLRVVGRSQIGSASWYGNRHVGRRTASGEALDAVRPTAAHRSLPLFSRVRVTNLNNGRSVVVTINDRGPVSRRLLIDVSPSAADQLDMKTAGIIPVTIEPVAAVARATQ
jgi:rare lipoprotein A